MLQVRYPYEGKPSWEHNNLGVHFKPASYYTDVFPDPVRCDYELGVLGRANISWVTMLTDGDSAIQKMGTKGEAVRYFLDPDERKGQRRIVPIIRDSTDKLPMQYTNVAFVKKLVPIYKEYGIRPTVILLNEPGDDREWRDNKVPSNWRDVFLDIWVNGARQIMDAGANAGFPDPLSEWWYYFERMPSDIVDAFRDGRAVFTAHLYGKSRPLNYPEDDISRLGVQTTYEEYRAEMDDFADIWGIPNIDLVNDQRRSWADPNKTFLDDPTCFGAWRNIYYYAEQIWGFRPVMCMTEGGWTPKDQAGSNPVDIRYPPTTPKKVAIKTVAASKEDHGMFALTPWIIYGWSDDGWIYSNLANVIDKDTGLPYGSEMPVIKALENYNIDACDKEKIFIDIESSIMELRNIFLNLGQKN